MWICAYKFVGYGSESAAFLNTLFIVSGGDAPGINALLLHYLSRSGDQDIVYGALGGFEGLLKGSLRRLSYRDVLPWSGMAGSILPSSREPVLSQPEAESRLKHVLTEYRIDQVVLFGGDGTLRHVVPLLRIWNIPCIGLPTTIDNDVPGTETTLGHDSACNFAYQSIDGIRATAHALSGRMFLVETLGGIHGQLALAVAHGSGAHAVLLPEYPYELTWLADRMGQAVTRFGFGLVVVCEGTPGARTLAESLPPLTEIRMRDVRLGHAQRGGTPTHADRVLAVTWADLIYESARNGVTSGVIVVQNGQSRLESEPLPNTSLLPDLALYQHINGLIS